jgi:hypothetical protein
LVCGSEEEDVGSVDGCGCGCDDDEDGCYLAEMPLCFIQPNLQLQHCLSGRRRGNLLITRMSSDTASTGYSQLSAATSGYERSPAPPFLVVEANLLITRIWCLATPPLRSIPISRLISQRVSSLRAAIPLRNITTRPHALPSAIVFPSLASRYPIPHSSVARGAAAQCLHLR